MFVFAVGEIRVRALFPSIQRRERAIQSSFHIDHLFGLVVLLQFLNCNFPVLLGKLNDVAELGEQLLVQLLEFVRCAGQSLGEKDTQTSEKRHLPLCSLQEEKPPFSVRV